MSYGLEYGTVRDSQRRPIYVLRVLEGLLDPSEIADLTERLRERLHWRGEVPVDIMVVQGDSKSALRLFGNRYYVARVRTNMFNAAISWSPIDLD